MVEKSRVLSFKYAIDGIYSAFKQEPNLKFHFLAAILVVILGFFLKVSRADFIILVIVIGLVISLELTNTAIETVINSFTTEEHPGAKLAKDVAAGAVLIAALTSIIVGVIIFYPYAWRLFTV